METYIPKYLKYVSLKGKSNEDKKQILSQQGNRLIFINDMHNFLKDEYISGIVTVNENNSQCYIFKKSTSKSSMLLHFDDLEGIINIDPDFTISLMKKGLL